MSAADIVITDHALVRWLERVQGLNVDELRAKLARHVTEAADAGFSKWYAPEAVYVFAPFEPGKTRVLTTVLPIHETRSRRFSRA